MAQPAAPNRKRAKLMRPGDQRVRCAQKRRALRGRGATRAGLCVPGAGIAASLHAPRR